ELVTVRGHVDERAVDSRDTSSRRDELPAQAEPASGPRIGDRRAEHVLAEQPLTEIETGEMQRRRRSVGRCRLQASCGELRRRALRLEDAHVVPPYGAGDVVLRHLGAA